MPHVDPLSGGQLSGIAILLQRLLGVPSALAQTFSELLWALFVSAMHEGCLLHNTERRVACWVGDCR